MRPAAEAVENLHKRWAGARSVPAHRAALNRPRIPAEQELAESYGA